MALQLITADRIGAGNQITALAAGDDIIILEGVTVASTDTSVFGTVVVDNINVTVNGALISGVSDSFIGANATFTIGSTGSYESYQSSQPNSALFLDGTSAQFVNYGSLNASNTIGVLFRGSGGVGVNHGQLLAASPVFIFNDTGIQFVNGGTVTAGIGQFSAGIGADRYNNGVIVSGSRDSIVDNLASGVITATANDRAGVAFDGIVDNGRLSNSGVIQSQQGWGVDLNLISALSGGLVSVTNRGTIEGQDGAFRGSVLADSLTNRGSMVGDIDMGTGNDKLDNRGGTVTGSIDLGDGDDAMFLGATVEVANGGAGLKDAIDISTGAGGVIDLTDEGRGTGLALGDILTGFERVYGSKSGVDTVYGNTASNLIYTYGGNDVIFADLGADAIYAGRGADTITGGTGNDTFGYQFINEFGDTITDFSSTGSGNDDRFTFRAANIGGGLVAGPLDPTQFQARADNVADANDRFIFRTTDTTLWFDVDGAGGVGPVMVADLQAGATVTAADIILV